MKFYICHDAEDSVFDCCFTLKEAKEIVHNAGGGMVVMVDVPVNAETVQKLLGNMGGYATNQKFTVIK